MTTSSHVCAFSSLAARAFWTILEIRGAGRIVKTHTQSIRWRAGSFRSFYFRLYRYTIHSYFFFIFLQIWLDLVCLKIKRKFRQFFSQISALITQPKANFHW